MSSVQPDPVQGSAERRKRFAIRQERGSDERLDTIGAAYLRRPGLDHTADLAGRYEVVGDRRSDAFHLEVVSRQRTPAEHEARNTSLSAASRPSTSRLESGSAYPARRASSSAAANVEPGSGSRVKMKFDVTSTMAAMRVIEATNGQRVKCGQKKAEQTESDGFGGRSSQPNFELKLELKLENLNCELSTLNFELSRFLSPPCGAGISTTALAARLLWRRRARSLDHSG